MKCETNHEWFCERIDGALDPERSARLDQHLAQCSACLAEFTALRLAVESMRREGRPQTSPDERAAIMAAIDREAEDRLVASAVAGEVVERRSGVFKRAMLMPQPVVAKRPGLGLLTHASSFAVGIAAAALFWFGTRAPASLHDSGTRTSPPPVTATAPALPPVVPPPTLANEPPPGTLLRVANQLKVLHNGHESAPDGSALHLKPGDTLEATSAGTWRIEVRKDGDLELFSKPIEPALIPAPRSIEHAPLVSRGPLFSIDLDPAPLHLLAERVRSSLDRATIALEHAAEAYPKSAPPTAPTAHEPVTTPIAMKPATSPPAFVANPTSDEVVSAPVASPVPMTAASAPRSPVVVSTEGDRVRLETSGPPLEVIPALVLRLRDGDPNVVGLVTARLELVREEYERDPTFPHVVAKDASAAKSVLRQVADYVIPAQTTPTVEDAHDYWARWFDTCADAIIARETFGTW